MSFLGLWEKGQGLLHNIIEVPLSEAKVVAMYPNNKCVAEILYA